MKLKNKTILIISPERWGTNFVSKHHYALELAKNNNVYFLNPDGTEKARFKTGGNIFSTPVVLEDNTVVVGSNDNFIYFLKLTE